MSADETRQWERVKEVFSEAVDLPEAERGPYLESACEGEPTILAEVRLLLAHHGQADDFLTEPVRDLAASLLTEEPEVSGDLIGPYRLVGEIDRGGMGVVYLAQRVGDYEQQVAIKVIKRGMDTDEVQRRFLAERQILARLQHPNVARILDGGVTEDARPYFVMEYIDGVPILRYCDERGLGLNERIEIFRTVCAAVHYAHQNLVLHRDLKPSNILLEADGTVKLLDFGVAKVLGTNAAAMAGLTQDTSRFMTLTHASPEQIGNQPLTTASDVYSLGVLLYQLLTGRKPYETAGLSAAEVERVICEEDPPRPSAVPQIEAVDNPGSAKGVDRRRLRGDLDTIVLKALRKDPRLRYNSAEQLAEDLERYAKGLPVAARRPSTAYWAAKFVRRHTLGVGAALASLVVLLVGGTALALQSVRIADERDKAQQVTTLLVDLFRGSDPSQALGDTLTARALLDRGARRIDGELAGQPEVQAVLLDAVAQVYQGLGLYDEAAPRMQRAVALLRSEVGPAHADLASAINNLGVLLDARGAYDEAQPLLEEALEMRRKLFRSPDPRVAESLNDLGQLLLYARRDIETAEPMLQQALTMRQSLFTPPHRDLAETLHNVALVRQLQGRYDEAVTLYSESLDMRRAIFDPLHPAIITTVNNLALVLHTQGDYERAEPLYRESMSIRERVLGSEHPSLAVAMGNLALLLADKTDLSGAEPLQRAALRLTEASVGLRHPRTATIQSNLADLLRLDGRLDEAQALYDVSLQTRLEVLGAEHPHVAFSLNGLALLSAARGDLETADSLHRRALAARRQVMGDRHPDVAQSEHGLGVVLASRGELAEAETHLRAALSIRQAAFVPNHPLIADSELALGQLLERVGRSAEAEPLLQAAMQIRQRVFSPDHWKSEEARAALANLLGSG